jgi:hypothetical protein
MMRWVYSLGFALGIAASAYADDVRLLTEVARNWLGERDRWSFRQEVREYDGKDLKQERVEIYDPSQTDASRWRLLSVNGRKPTPGEWQDWYKRKYKRHHHPKPSAEENFDFSNAKVEQETSQSVRYVVPLRNSIEWLFPVSKVELLVTINKTGPSLEKVQARISEPFRVALGLARILDIDLDLQMTPPPERDPANAKPTGTASAVVTKMGERVEYFWTNFRRVTPHAREADAG